MPTRLCGAGLVAALVGAAPIWANVGAPTSGGHLVGEPHGIKDVAIARETLTIDLRPLAEMGLARVEAVYHLTNRGPAKSLDLIFASGASGVTGFEIWLDDVRVPAAPAPDATIPAKWQGPAKTPGLNGGNDLDYLRYGARALTPIAFSVVVPSGQATLRVSYAAEAATHQYGNPTVYRQFGYVLAPAKSWAGFGGLHVTVHLPPGWHAASSPALDRDGDTLTGHFNDVPADTLALTVQAPAGWAYNPARYGTLALMGLTLIGGAFACWWGGRSRGRRIRRAVEYREPGPRMAWPTSLALAFGWGVATLVFGLLAIFGPTQVLPDGQATQYGYGPFLVIFGLIVLCLVLVPVGFVIAQVTAVIAAAPRSR